MRYADANERVFKTISLTVPKGQRVNVDYSAVSLEDIIIDALPLQNGKMIGTYFPFPFLFLLIFLFCLHETQAGKTQRKSATS